VAATAVLAACWDWAAAAPGGSGEMGKTEWQPGCPCLPHRLTAWSQWLRRLRQRLVLPMVVTEGSGWCTVVSTATCRRHATMCGQLLHRQLHVLLLLQLLLLKRLMLLLPPLLRRMVEACMLRFGVRPSRSRASTLRWNGSHHALRPPLLAGGGPERRRDSRRVGHVQSLPAPSSAPAAARRLPLVCDAFEILREMYA
jgi:hypothetical protein